jgi:hypothetical protein
MAPKRHGSNSARHRDLARYRGSPFSGASKPPYNAQ